MTATVKAPVNVTALIGTLAERGRQFTDARNAVIAHALITGTKASVIVAESGVDKGDVSRINKVVSNLTPSKAKALKALVLSAVNVDDVSTMTVLVKFGADNLRRVKAAPKSAPATKSATGEDETTDFRALVHDFIVNAPDHAAAVALVMEAVESAEQFLAEAAAEADAA